MGLRVTRDVTVGGPFRVPQRKPVGVVVVGIYTKYQNAFSTTIRKAAPKCARVLQQDAAGVGEVGGNWDKRRVRRDADHERHKQDRTIEKF